MSLLTANKTPVVSAYISIPRIGRGIGDLIVDREFGLEAGDKITLAWEDGTQYECTVAVGHSDRGRWRMRVEMGAGRMARNLPSRYYEGIPAATVARDIIVEAGETPGDIDLPGTLLRYVRRAAPAYEQLAALLADTGRYWRIEPDGKVKIGIDSYPNTAPIPIINAYPPARRYQLPLTPSLQTGVSLVGLVDDDIMPLGKVERVAHQVSARWIATEVWCGN
ncbi:hypothetical protein [Meiothermus phage MMP17]|nr:hypothetical protein [Meiothermus phage MMP7]QAY18056.1 hypothetical protein [Meiothermus phage MMP17]